MVLGTEQSPFLPFLVPSFYVLKPKTTRLLNLRFVDDGLREPEKSL
jgi:hypothetical protein